MTSAAPEVKGVRTSVEDLAWAAFAEQLYDDSVEDTTPGSFAEQLYDDSVKAAKVVDEYARTIAEIRAKAKGSAQMRVILDRDLSPEIIKRLQTEDHFHVTWETRPHVIGDCPCTNGCAHCATFTRTIISWVHIGAARR
jgi:hypothetical protein